MNKPIAIQIDLNQELDDQLTTIAMSLDRSKTSIIEQAITDYIAVQAWQRTAIEEGIRAADRGEVVPHEEVARWMRSWGTADELPMPECG